jgi:hypothetical protein
MGPSSQLTGGSVSPSGDAAPSGGEPPAGTNEENQNSGDQWNENQVPDDTGAGNPSTDNQGNDSGNQ